MTMTDRNPAHLMQVSCRDVELPSHCNACDRDVVFRLPVHKKARALGVGEANQREERTWWDIKAVFPVVCPHEDCLSWTLLRIEFTSTFVKQNGTFDAQLMDAGHAFHEKSTTVVWPPRVRPLGLEGVPSGIAQDMSEGAACMAQGQHKAAALLFGRAIDKACDVKAQEKRLGMNLKRKLQAALDANHISRMVYEAAEAVRGVRNFSAHGDFDLHSGVDVPDLPEEDADATCTAAIGVLIEMFVKGGLVEALRQKYPAR